MIRILVADDDELIRRQWHDWLEGKDYALTLASDGAEAVEKAVEVKPSICVLDVRMPRMDGVEALKKIKALLPETEVIMVTAHADVQTAVTTMKEGAYDYLVKPVPLADALAAIQRAAEKQHLLSENRYLRLELGKDATYSQFVGETAVIAQLREKMDQAAGTSAAVLIGGESGTGKELVARLIHYGSDRSKGPFVAVNIAALPETLIESEMFGHEKNAFTGAADQRIGRFELADKGTLLLDEISEIPVQQQVKFLRVLEEGEIQRVGGTSPIKTNARIISTTNRDLEASVKEGEFREDLYYRLNVFYIELPPLRQRKDDIPLIADHYLKIHARKENKSIASISKQGMERLQEFSWPGNVRELIHCIESAVIMEGGGELSLESIVAAKLPESPGAGSGTAGEGSCLSLEDAEKEHIRKALEASGGHKTKTASILHISRSTLYKKMEQYGLS